MSTLDANELLDYASTCPPLSISIASFVGTLKERKSKTLTKEVALENAEVLSGVMGNSLTSGQKLPPHLREMLDWAEREKARLKIN